MIIDHIAVAVADIDKVISHWEDSFGYKQHTKKTTNTRQKVNVVFLSKKDSLTIKLIEPSEESSPLMSFIKKHAGGGLHHICFKCDDLNDGVTHLKANGLRMFTKPEPGEAFGNEDIAFLLSKSFVNIELIDTDKKEQKI